MQQRCRGTDTPFRPAGIISTGVAGGIDRCLKVMDVVARVRTLSTTMCGAEEGNAYGQIQGMPTFFEGHPTLLDCAMSLDTRNSHHGGLICSGDKFITDRTEVWMPSRATSPKVRR